MLCHASQSLFSVYFWMQVKTVVWYPKWWMDLPSLVEQQALSWCSKMKLIISDSSYEGNAGSFLEPPSVKSGCTTKPISFSFWGEGVGRGEEWMRICEFLLIITELVTWLMQENTFHATYFHLSECLAHACCIFTYFCYKATGPFFLLAIRFCVFELDSFQN